MTKPWLVRSNSERSAPSGGPRAAVLVWALAAACSTERGGTVPESESTGSAQPDEGARDGGLTDAALDASLGDTPDAARGAAEDPPDAGSLPCGDGTCPVPFLEIDERIAMLLADVRTFATPEERSDVRYLDLSSLSNAGYAGAPLDQLRDGLSYLLNSLSRGTEVVPLSAVDDRGLVLRVRLSAYGFTAASWESIVAGYPYALRYDESSPLFSYDEDRAEELRTETGTAIPYVHADWFFAHASRPPLYYALLGIPERLDQLLSELEIDTAANLADGTAVRAGVSDSGPSRYHRVIERHPVSPVRGSLWLTHDFSSGVGTSNIFTHPLDFVAGSSELLFHLPNGLQGYMIVDAAGRRIDRAPNNSVQDELAPDRVIEAGISCLSCHAESGLMRVKDEVRASVMGASADPEQTRAVLAVYPEQSALDALFAGDEERYHKALKAVRAPRFLNGTAHALDAEHQRLMQLSDVAAVLGIESRELVEVIELMPAAIPTRILALYNVPDAKIPRDAFDAVYPELVRALGLGEPIVSP